MENQYFKPNEALMFANYKQHEVKQNLLKAKALERVASGYSPQGLNPVITEQIPPHPTVNNPNMYEAADIIPKGLGKL